MTGGFYQRGMVTNSETESDRRPYTGGFMSSNKEESNRILSTKDPAQM